MLLVCFLCLKKSHTRSSYYYMWEGGCSTFFPQSLYLTYNNMLHPWVTIVCLFSLFCLCVDMTSIVLVLVCVHCFFDCFLSLFLFFLLPLLLTYTRWAIVIGTPSLHRHRTDANRSRQTRHSIDELTQTMQGWAGRSMNWCEVCLCSVWFQFNLPNYQTLHYTTPAWI